MRPHIQRPHLGTTCYFFCSAVSTTVCTVKILDPFSPPIVELRPYFVRFVSSNFYGAGPFATSTSYFVAQPPISDRAGNIIHFLLA